MNTSEDRNIPKLPGYMSIKEAAAKLGRSERRLYEYAQQGRIRAYKAGRTTMLLEEDVNAFQKQPVGRKRTTMPIWRTPTGDNLQYTTVIFANLRAGSEAKLAAKLAEIRAGKKHLLPGTVARYIARNAEKPNEIHILLIWRSTVMPAEAEREAALAALRADLAEVVDWETAWSEQGQVLMHT
jgi:excisionase family DNA binding protein